MYSLNTNLKSNTINEAIKLYPEMVKKVEAVEGKWEPYKDVEPFKEHYEQINGVIKKAKENLSLFKDSIEQAKKPRLV